MRATELVWTAAGQPPVRNAEDMVDGVCAFCREPPYMRRRYFAGHIAPRITIIPEKGKRVRPIYAQLIGNSGPIPAHGTVVSVLTSLQDDVAEALIFFSMGEYLLSKTNT